MDVRDCRGDPGSLILKKNQPKDFHKATVSFVPTPGKNTSQVLEDLSLTSFQGRSLGQALSIWRQALSSGATIFFGLSGALVPAGFRKTVAYLIENHLIDVLVTTGANMFHDVHQSYGGAYYLCSPNADDKVLREHRMDRMYDVAASDREFEEIDANIATFAKTLERRPHTTREFFNLLGKAITEEVEEDGIVTTAYKNNVPIFCPAIADSSFGLALAIANIKENVQFNFDVVGDIVEMVSILDISPGAAEIIMGGGTPKNFIQQAAVVFDLTGRKSRTYKYCVQVTTDAPHWGGLSGCTFEESTSWGKIHFEAEKVAVYCDASIGLPLLAQALAEEQAWKLRPQIPTFKMGPKLEPHIHKQKVLVG